MTDFDFAATMSLAFQAVAWLCAGVLLGAAYFLTLQWSVRLFVFGRSPLVAAAMQFGRFLFLAGLLAVIADCCGALPLTMAAVGVLVPRTMMTTRPTVLT